uniref:Histone H2A/H2B/H3 domain-containing protein n=1 Tax=Oryctolagus cuniculus TaxID=9986 RepID=G1U2A7_RABIT
SKGANLSKGGFKTAANTQKEEEQWKSCLKESRFHVCKALSRCLQTRVSSKVVSDVLERISREVLQVAQDNGCSTVTPRKTYTARRQLLPGELAKQVVSRGPMAVTEST